MQSPNEKMRYIEDIFDLHAYRRKSVEIKQRKQRQRKGKRMIRLLSGAIVLLIIIALFYAARIQKYNEELSRNTQTSEIVHELVYTEPEAVYMHIPEQASRDTAAPETPVAEAPRQVLDKITDLRDAFSNEEIVGYLEIEGTQISYAVVQGVDNTYYLQHDLYGEQNAAGTVFMDYECDAATLSRNTVIYGHNMKNGTMFHNLRYYADEGFYNEHRYVKLTTPYEETVWEVFAFYKAKTDFYYIQVLFPDDAAFAQLLTQMQERAAYDTGVSVGVSDKVLTLSTCAGTAASDRLVLNAKLVEVH